MASEADCVEGPGSTGTDQGEQASEPPPVDAGPGRAQGGNVALDVVYPLLASRDNCEELRYSLRSIDTNAPTHGRVILLQDKPRWIRGVEHLPVAHGSLSRFDRVKNNLRALLAWPDCPDAFAFWNDDFYRMKPLERYEAQDRGSAVEFGRQQMATMPSVYHRSVMDTAELLIERGYPDPLCYEVHAPIVVHADTLRLTFEMFAGVDTLWQWRTAYGNVAGLQSSQVTDPKVGGKRDEADPCWPWISTSPLSWRGKAGRSIRATFTEPSRYEAQ